MDELIRISAERPSTPRPDVKRFKGRVLFGKGAGAELTLDVGPAAEFDPARALVAGVAAFGPRRFAEVGNVDPRAILQIVGLAEGGVRDGWEDVMVRVMAEPSMAALLTAAATVPAESMAEPLMIAARAVEALGRESERFVLPDTIRAEDIAKRVNEKLAGGAALVRLQPEDVRRAARCWWSVRNPQEERAIAAYRARHKCRIGSPDHKDLVALWFADDLARDKGVRIVPDMPAFPLKEPEILIPEPPRHVGCACKARQKAS